jgi:hypothetical protein
MFELAAFLTLIRMAVKKCIAVQLAVLYDSQATNRELRELLCQCPTPHPLPSALLLVTWESYKPLAGLNTLTGFRNLEKLYKEIQENL